MVITDDGSNILVRTVLFKYQYYLVKTRVKLQYNLFLIEEIANHAYIISH
jgi:hypothetical protein